MPFYIVNRNAQPLTGDHEVHEKYSSKGCLPLLVNQEELGYFENCAQAVQRAKQFHYWDSDGCAVCIPSCHKS